MKRIIIYLFLLFLVQTVNGQTNKIETLEINSTIFKGKRLVKVLLPSEYNIYPNRKYNVIYVFDAQNDDFFNNIINQIEFLKTNSPTHIEPAIIIGIVTANRQFEFLPKNKTDQPLKDYWKSVKLGGADTLAISLRDEIIPIIGNKYRCNNYNTAIGHSLGGTFVTSTLVKYPQLFNAVIAISPNYYYDNEQILHTFDSIATSPILKNKFLYIAYGKGDQLEDRFRPSSIKMDSILQNKNILNFKWHTKSLDIDSHSLTPMEVFRGILSLNEEFGANEKQIIEFYKDQNVSLITKLKDYYKKQSSLTGLQLPLIGDLNQLAYTCQYLVEQKKMGKRQDYIDILSWALSLYPEDSNLYDSMGEFHEFVGDKKEALLFYSGGLKIVEKQKELLSISDYQSKVDWFTERLKKIKEKQ